MNWGLDGALWMGTEGDEALAMAKTRTTETMADVGVYL